MQSGEKVLSKFNFLDRVAHNDGSIYVITSIPSEQEKTSSYGLIDKNGWTWFCKESDWEDTFTLCAPVEPLNQFIETTVEIRTREEYLQAVYWYVMAGATIWPWHKEYKHLPHCDPHHLYGWEPAGFMKHAVGECCKGTYKNTEELREAISEVRGLEY